MSSKVIVKNGGNWELRIGRSRERHYSTHKTLHFRALQLIVHSSNFGYPSNIVHEYKNFLVRNGMNAYHYPNGWGPELGIEKWYLFNHQVEAIHEFFQRIPKQLHQSLPPSIDRELTVREVYTPNYDGLGGMNFPLLVDAPIIERYAVYLIEDDAQALIQSKEPLVATLLQGHTRFQRTWGQIYAGSVLIEATISASIGNYHTQFCMVDNEARQLYLQRAFGHQNFELIRSGEIGSPEVMFVRGPFGDAFFDTSRYNMRIPEYLKDLLWENYAPMSLAYKPDGQLWQPGMYPGITQLQALSEFRILDADSPEF